MAQKSRKKIAVALQGGGSWGAYSWGVLDRLLADPQIEITDICGTSAGALSGSIVAHAVNSAPDYETGAKQAREDLRRFWTSVSDKNHDMMRLLAMMNGKSPFATFRNPVLDPNLPALGWLQNGKSIMNANPMMKYSGLSGIFNKVAEGTATRKLRALIRDFIPSYDVIREGKRLKLHVNAAEMTDKGLVNRNFSGSNLSIDAVMASATLQGLFEPVDIDGKKYYDGAYAQNPPVDTLLKQDRKKRRFDDVLWVMTNPPKGRITPRHQDQIPPHELSQSANLVLHHAFDHLAYEVSSSTFGSPRNHAIWFNAPMHYNQTSKQNTESAFLDFLFNEGHKSADQFLKAHTQNIGKKSTVDLTKIRNVARRRSASPLWPK